jgi:hypothetical protein
LDAQANEQGLGGNQTTPDLGVTQLGLIRRDDAGFHTGAETGEEACDHDVGHGER